MKTTFDPPPGGAPTTSYLRSRGSWPLCVACCLLVLMLFSCADESTTVVGSAAEVRVQALAEQYVERYLELFPTRATALGRTDWDGELEDLSPEVLEEWLAYNVETAVTLEEALQERLSRDTAADARLLLRQAQKARLDLAERRLPQTHPLFWTRILGNSGVFLLVRTDRALVERVRLLEQRASRVPRLADQARAALGTASAEMVSSELARIAARQAAASADFYAKVAPAAAEEAGLAPGDSFGGAAEACRQLAEFLEELAGRSRGSARLGDAYRQVLALWSGEDRAPEEVLESGMSALEEKRAEAAAYGREIWATVMAGDAPPDDSALLRALFSRLSEDRASNVDEFIRDYQSLVDEAIHFVSDLDLLTLPEFSLITDRSPDFFVGQSVGGVYSPGPYSPTGETLFYLPTPPPDASAEQRDALFRDFNHHFNVMIVPHEIVPGHDTHLRWAASHPSRVRAIFADAVTTEGWGTFSERLLLDLGWGDELARTAHLKKQLENIARTIVDIGVHTQGWPRDRVLDFVQNEALQDVQFAENMWQRSLTTAPQLTSYWLGYERFSSLYEEARQAQGESFELKPFLDRIMQVAPVGGDDLRELVLRPGEGAADGSRE